MFHTGEAPPVDPIHAIQALHNAHPAPAGCNQFKRAPRAANHQDRTAGGVIRIRNDLHLPGFQSGDQAGAK
jgi:hypothetical protein